MATGRKNVKELAQLHGTTVEKLLETIYDKLPPEGYVGKGKNTWVNPEQLETLKLALEAPLVIPTRLKGRVIKLAVNPRWVYCVIEGLENKHPVMVPSRLRDRILGKSIEIEAITDDRGTSYRYARRNSQS